MPVSFRSAWDTFRGTGILGFLYRGIQYAYNNYLRPFLPRRIVQYNGFPVRAAHVGDSIIPWQETDIPTYENALIEGIRNQVQLNDAVVIVGGGWGISAIAAAHQVGEEGTVIVYEGAYSMVDKSRETVALNGFESIISIRHDVVAIDIALKSQKNGADTIPPEELPACDVLVLDCEGAEKSILDNLDNLPRSVIVESHGIFGAPTTDIKNLLTSLGYKIQSKNVAEERFRDFCLENDIHVLVAS